MSRQRDCWTKALPDEPGWYWWRTRMGVDERVVLVTEKFRVVQMFSHNSGTVGDWVGEWYGPIVPPGGDAIENCEGPSQ